MTQRTIAGRYELIEQIGDSSWRAVDAELGREVLVRLPAGEVVAATLAHPNVVRVFDQGEEDGERYAVFEYLPGGSLEQRLAAGSLSEAEARGVAADVEAALAYAHAQGVTHGSLRPDSVLLDAEGRAKVAGFAGGAEPEDDTRAFGVLLQILGVDALGSPDADVTAVIQAPPATGRRRVALATIAALALLAAGIGAAFLATSGGSKPDGATSSFSVRASTGRTEPTTQEPEVSQPATTAATTTAVTTSTNGRTTTAPPATSAPPPPATTEAPPTTEPPPATTEEPPPATTEPPPATTEEPLPTTTQVTTAQTTLTVP